MEDRHDIEAPPYAYAAPTDTMGLSHIRLALADLEWPATTDELRRRAGNWRIPVTGEHMHPLSQFLEGIDGRARFRGPDALVKAIRDAHPQLREQR